MKIIIIAILLSAILLIVVESAKKPFSRYVILYNDMNCTHNSKYVSHFSCDIMQPEKQHLTAYVIFTMDILSGLKCKARIDVPRPNNQIMNLFEMEVDVCKFFNGEYDNNVIKIGRQTFDTYGNFTQCPLRKDIAFGLMNFTVDVSKFPYAPETDFILNLIYLLPQNIETFRVRLTGSLEMRRKRPLIVAT